jgi:hypothetical protein
LGIRVRTEAFIGRGKFFRGQHAHHGVAGHGAQQAVRVEVALGGARTKSATPAVLWMSVSANDRKPASCACFSRSSGDITPWLKLNQLWQLRNIFPEMTIKMSIRWR